MKKLIIRILRLLGIKSSPEEKQSNNNSNSHTSETKTKEESNSSNPMNTPTTSNDGPTLYALLIAIDNYPIKRHRLNGCVADRNAFQAFLERRFDKKNFKHNIKILTDQEAYKENIIKKFEHFQAAKDGDICVFYFSGHGSRANAPREFWHLDPDRMNESVVAYDSRVQGGKDLMDKELSYLFWEATWDKDKNKSKDLHFTAVFDCCHSGTITRNAVFSSMVNQEVTERMAEPSPVPNRLEDYHGFEFYKKVETDQGLNVSPPVGKFIQLAASKDDETAKELKIRGKTRGIFTYNLIEVLEQSNIQMTYSDLIRTLQIRVGAKVNKQTPQLITDNNDLRNNLFLGGVIKAAEPYYTINYDGQHWIMDAGLIQGIPDEGGYLELEDGTPVIIEKVEANRSIIRDLPGVDRNTPHTAFAKGINFKKLNVALDKSVSSTANTIITSSYNDSPPNNLNIVGDTDQADYLIREWDESLILTTKGSSHPLFKRVQPISDSTTNYFLDQADAIGKWNNLLELKNPRSSIKEEEFEIKLFRISEPGNLEDSASADLLDYKAANLFSYQKKGGEWHQPAFRLSIKNKGQRTLYFSAVFLQANFEITNKYLPFKELIPGSEEAWMIDFFENEAYKTIPLELYDALHSWNITETKEFIKIFISTDPFLSTNDYEQKALEMDVLVEGKPPERAGRTKANTPQIPDWITREIEMNIVRPLESQEVGEGRTVNLLGDSLSISMPDGVSSHVSFSGKKEAERAISGQFDSSMPDSTAISNLWGTDNMSTEYSFSEEIQNQPGLSVLELENLVGVDKVDIQNPIKLKINEQLSDNEFVIPMGFDSESGLYYPLGQSNADGEILIEGLPQETQTRSLGRSIKLFFHKVILAPLGIEYNWPQLALATFTSEEEFEYEKDLDKIKAAIEGATNIGIMIHGIIGNTKAMPPSMNQLFDSIGQKVDPHFDIILTFDYENLNTPIEETARAFKQKLEEVGLGEGHYKNVTIIAHSMGGLVSRWMIEKENGQHLINHLVMCGTPNNGSPWANVQELAGVLLSKAINGAAFLKPYILPLMLLQKLGKGLFITLQQMHTKNSDFLKQLNDGTDPNIPYTIVMGNTSLADDIEEEAQKSLLAKLSTRFTDMTYDALTKFLFEIANDIAVSKPSATELNGSEAWSCTVTVEEVDCDHLSYFTSNEGTTGLAKVLK